MSVVGFDTAHQNIRDLAIDSPLLEDYRERFLKLYDRRKFEVLTFQEAQGMKGTSILDLNRKVLRVSLRLYSCIDAYQVLGRR